MSDTQLTRTLHGVSETESESKRFFEVPWIFNLLSQPGIVLRIPGCRQPKDTTEDSLMSEMLKNTRGIESSICFFKEPAQLSDPILEVTTLFAVGDGMNGHPALLHGGIIATLIDESMGIYKSVNHEHAEEVAIEATKGGEKKPRNSTPYFTAELKVTYVKPVQTPSHIMVIARHVKKEGRKEWLSVELKQKRILNRSTDEEGELITCATGQALFISLRPQNL